MSIKKAIRLSAVALCVFAGETFAAPQSGKWVSPNIGFQIGGWQEQFIGGDLAALGNLFSAGGLDSCCYSIDSAELMEIVVTGENAYRLHYSDASLRLANDEILPWYNADDGVSEYFSPDLKLIVDLVLIEEAGEMVAIRLDMSASGSLESYNNTTILLSGFYEGLPDLLNEDPDMPLEGNGFIAPFNGGGLSIQRHSIAQMDIKPNSCRNPVNVRSRGVLPVVIAGAQDIDVANIDPASIRLAGVAPIRSSIEDTITSGDGVDCENPAGDGLADLTLKFNVQELMLALDAYDIAGGTVVPVTLIGAVSDTATFEATDSLFIVNPRKKPSKGNKGGNGATPGGNVPSEPGNNGNGKGWGPENNPGKQNKES